MRDPHTESHFFHLNRSLPRPGEFWYIGPMENPIISLTTDFGLDDPFVGILKGVMLRINPRIRFLDVSHSVDPQDVLQGALVLSAFCRYCPRGTVHLAVVDPGVGGKRRPICVEAEDGFFVGPDNGILSLALKGRTVREIVELNNPDYFLKPVSQTFHGRDIFAPAAAYAASGVPIQNLGDPIERIEGLAVPDPSLSGRGVLKGEVIYIDRFGNCAVNIGRAEFESARKRFRSNSFSIRIGRNIITKISGSYQEGAAAARQEGESPTRRPAVKKGPPGAIFNSWNLLEFFVYKKSARDEYGIRIGTPVEIRFRTKK